MITTFNENHSISEVVFNIILPYQILDIKIFRNFIDDNEFSDFRSFKTTQGVKVDIGFDNGKHNISTKNDKSGFIIESFSAGLIDWVIKYEPQTPSISIHCLNYTRWNQYLEYVKKLITKLSQIDTSLTSKAIALNYIDQLFYNGLECPNSNVIFNSNNSIIPKKVFEKSSLWSYNLNIVTDGSIQDSLTEIINVGLKKTDFSRFTFFLSHTCVIEFEPKNLSEIKTYENIFVETLNKMHSKNKIFLKDTLNETTLKLINLS